MGHVLEDQETNQRTERLALVRYGKQKNAWSFTQV